MALNLINRENIRSSSRFSIAYKLARGQVFWQEENRRILLLEHQKSAGWALVTQYSTRCLIWQVLSINPAQVSSFRLGTRLAFSWALSGTSAMFKCAFPPPVSVVPGAYGAKFRSHAPLMYIFD